MKQLVLPLLIILVIALLYNASFTTYAKSTIQEQSAVSEQLPEVLVFGGF